MYLKVAVVIVGVCLGVGVLCMLLMICGEDLVKWRALVRSRLDSMRGCEDVNQFSR